jgi:hypothetical protein
MPTYHKTRRDARKTSELCAVNRLKLHVDDLQELLEKPKPHLSRWRRKITIAQEGINIALHGYRRAQRLGLIKRYQPGITWDKEVVA